MAEVKIAVDNISVNIVCECGAGLNAVINRFNDEITVEPCEKCLDKRYEEGYAEGDKDGYETGKTEGGTANG